jgi:phosphoribosylpyrophosphate synthetase
MLIPKSRMRRPSSNTPAKEISENVERLRDIAQTEGIKTIFNCLGDIRMAWIDQFDPKTGDADKAAIRKLLRAKFDHAKTECGEHREKVENLLALRGNHRKETDLDDLRRRSDNFVLLPIIAKGYFHTGPIVADEMDDAEMGYDLVFGGAPRPSSLGQYNRFRSGLPLLQKAYFDETDSRFLDMNSSRPVLMVDDVIETGHTARTIAEDLRSRGYNDIFLWVATEKQTEDSGFMQFGLTGRLSEYRAR